MIGSALENNLIPGKCFSKKGCNCINAVMTIKIICDESRIHHHNECIAGNYFWDCYDRAPHPVSAVLLQSLGVPQLATNVLLGTMETMRFFLHTGFGESVTSHGGTHEERLTGYGQENAAAGPGFTAMSYLFVGWSCYSKGGCHETWEMLRVLNILPVRSWSCKVANSLGSTQIYCSNYPSIGWYCPIASAGSATRWIYSSNTNFMQRQCISYAWDIFLPNIRWQDTYLWDGLERIHLGQSDKILTPSPLSCMAKSYTSTTTRHKVGSCHCHPVHRQTFRTISKILLQMPPAPQRQLPYRSSVETYTREISRFGNGKSCPGVPFIEAILSSV